MLRIADSKGTSLSVKDGERRSESIVTGETSTGLNCSVRKTERSQLKNENIDEVTNCAPIALNKTS